MSQISAEPKSFVQKILDVVEKVGNKVPHPAVIFLILIGLVIVLSHLLWLQGVSVTYEEINEKTYVIEKKTTAVNSLLTKDGVRFMYERLIPNFMSFTAVGLMITAMIGVGVAEESGLIKALIRKLVIVAPAWALCYILVFVGIVSSIAADAGYLVLIPLAGTAFLSVGRHPIAGLAAGFASVAGAFTVNMLIKPLDAVLTEFTNDAIHLVDPTKSIGLTSNLWFSLASVVFLTFIMTWITERLIEPRLGKYQPPAPDHADTTNTAGKTSDSDATLSAAESRGLLFAGLGLMAVLGLFAWLSLPADAPLRDPETGALIGNSPFMNGLIAIIMVLFLVMGTAYGYGAGTLNSVTAIIKAMEKALSGLGGLLLLFFIISQFVAMFNHSNMATILAVTLADTLKSANIGPLWLLVGFIIVVALLDFLISGAIAKWAIFAPIFVPVLMRLNVDPEAVLAAYRIGDSPVNTITPLNAYFALVVGFAMKYDKKAGVGTVVSLMLPYVLITFVLWTLLFVGWFLLGIPWGL
ncbi:MAG: AbgT family transporter [Pirellulales bacterium]|nr:AbgT family transporter [Pirellulales bacterium]